MGSFPKPWRLVYLRTFLDPSGTLVVGAENGEPFPLRRVFSVTAPAGALRGMHAHKECAQFLTVPSGSAQISLSTLDSSEEIILDSSSLGLYVPPMVWGSQRFIDVDSVLMVFCNMEFSESDYIRDWQEYVSYASSRSEPHE